MLAPPQALSPSIVYVSFRRIGLIDMKYVSSLLLCGALLLGSTGCDAFKTRAIVSSNTSWSGSFDGRTIDGQGNQTIDLGGGGSTGGPSKCAVVQKQTREGTLTVRIEPGDEQTTTAAFGVVSVCGGR